MSAPARPTRHAVAAALAACLAGMLASADIGACTTFCVAWGGQVIFGRNYDFDFGRGLVLVNPRGLRKTGALPQGPRWTARHGSLTFNQFGRDYPMGGMNEAGLVVELMEGNIASAMEPFTDARNRALVEASYNDFPATRRTPPREREQVVTQPFAAAAADNRWRANASGPLTGG